MKNLKSNNRILSYLICFSLLAFVNISCNENDDLETFEEESEKEKKEVLVESMANKGIKTGRTRLKKRRTGLYRVSVVVDKDNKNTVSTVAVEIESKKGLIPETKTYYLDYFTTLKGEKYYTFGDIKFENKEMVNQEVTVNITLLDAKKQPISTSTGTTVIEGLSNANIKRTRIKRRPNGIYKMTAEIVNNEDNEVAEIEVSVNDLQGNTTTFKEIPNKNNTINAKFSFEKESTSDKMLVAYTLKDVFGDVINTFKVELEIDTKKSNAIIITNSIKIKRKANGLYELTARFKDAKNEVAEILLTLTNSEGKILNLKNKIVNNKIVSIFELPNYETNLLIINFTLKDKFDRTLYLYRDEVYAE